MMLLLMQADAHRDDIVLEKIKNLDADGLVNFIITNEVRYITEYNQVVGPTKVFITIVHMFSHVSLLFPVIFPLPVSLKKILYFMPLHPFSTP